MRGSRVQNVVSELRGEKIDIIPWSPDTARFACAALAPAEVARVYVDADEQALEIIVPDDQLSLAIGKKGQNVRLAAKLIGWKIDIKSETRAAEIDQEESLLSRSLMRLPDWPPAILVMSFTRWPRNSMSPDEAP
jgi:N utilization substance protein A